MSICLGKNCHKEGDYGLKALVPAKEDKFFECAPIEVYCAVNLCWDCIHHIRPKDIFDSETRRGISEIMSQDHEGTPDFNNSILQVISSNEVILLMTPSPSRSFH